MPEEHRLSSLLFSHETTHRSDYRGGEVDNLIHTRYRPRQPCLAPRPPPLKDGHTLSYWKRTVPFSLLHRPKEVVGTSPHQIQEVCEKYPDLGLEAAIRSRPRLVMTPAVSLDDISEPDVRHVLVHSMYTSSAARAQRELRPPRRSARAPLPDLPAPANAVTLPKLRPAPVHNSWRIQSLGWDRSQLRSHCHPTREFWMRRNPPQCIKCEESAALMH